jgi:hypothetical protein
MPPPWQTPIRLRVNLQSFETRCRVRRWIIQEADMLPGTAQRAYIVQSRPQSGFALTGTAGIQGAELLN